MIFYWIVLPWALLQEADSRYENEQIKAHSTQSPRTESYLVSSRSLPLYPSGLRSIPGAQGQPFLAQDCRSGLRFQRMLVQDRSKTCRTTRKLALPFPIRGQTKGGRGTGDQASNCKIHCPSRAPALLTPGSHCHQRPEQDQTQGPHGHQHRHQPKGAPHHQPLSEGMELSQRGGLSLDQCSHPRTGGEAGRGLPEQRPGQSEASGKVLSALPGKGGGRGGF